MYKCFCSLAFFQLQAALDKLEKDVDTARANVTNMAAMIPMVTEQFDKNQQQLAITEQKANDAHGESVTAEKVCGRDIGMHFLIEEGASPLFQTRRWVKNANPSPLPTYQALRLSPRLEVFIVNGNFSFNSLHPNISMHIL